ncbi:MAG: site-specific DNA-methyltransferase [Akkermansia sp.]|nr:site-specific DNA-methyltransferase [Akkermansia sp.]
MNKLNMQSYDVIASNVEKIAKLFPNCVTERLNKEGNPELAIDFEKLQAELSNDIIVEGEERYQFTWPDKRAAVRLANTPTTMTLRPCREESVDFDNTQNLYIEGDNLDVLKVLRETYLGKVKMIYIDPPYNTGHDFVYNDDFTESYEEFAKSCKAYDENGNLQFNPQENGESNGRFHTDWLNMIYPRLKVARDLLSEDGFIFISIDHNEVINLTKIGDEVFGTMNRIGVLSVINNLKSRSDDRFFATCNEFLLVYAKNYNSALLKGFELEDEELDDDYEKQDEISYYKLIGYRKTGNAWSREERPYMFYPVLYKNGYFSTISTEEYKRIYNGINFDDDFINDLTVKYSLQGYRVVWPKSEEGAYGRWRWKRETFLQQKDINLEFNKAGTLCTKMRATLDDGSIRVKSAKTLWYKPEYDTGSSGRVLKKLFNNLELFDNPKSLVYLQDIVKIATDIDSLVIDFFSGSATTAHSVMNLNAYDGGKRKFIMVQLPELTDEKSEAYKAGYKNICEIGKERIRRAGKNAKEVAGLQGKNLDIGFRVLKLDSSNMADVYYTPQESGQKTLFDENVKPDRSNEDLLFQVMLDLGIELSVKIEAKQIVGKTVHFVDGNYLVACFDSEVNETTIKEIAKLQPVYFVIRDSSAANDCVIDNFEQIFKHYSPTTTCRII